MAPQFDRALRECAVRVVDLSADFRLADRATYERWYGEHVAGSVSVRLASIDANRVRSPELFDLVY